MLLPGAATVHYALVMAVRILQGLVEVSQSSLTVDYIFNLFDGATVSYCQSAGGGWWPSRLKRFAALKAAL